MLKPLKWQEGLNYLFAVGDQGCTYASVYPDCRWELDYIHGDFSRHYRGHAVDNTESAKAACEKHRLEAIEEA